MLIQKPILATQFAAMRESAQAQDAPFWLPDSLHALIMSCLIDIFARLENLFLAWQSGALPTAQRRPAFAPRLPAPAPALRSRGSARIGQPRTLRRPAASPTLCARNDTARPAPDVPERFQTQGSAPVARPRSARAPPQSRAPIRRGNPPAGLAQSCPKIM